MNLISTFWWAWNCLAFIPLMSCSITRFLYTEKQQKKSYILDHVVRVCIFPSLIYYFIDSFNILTQWHRMGWCNLAYLLHHIFCLLGFREIITLTIYPWFLIIPFALHCVLLMFPLMTQFNYIYFGLMVNCIYRLFLKPWRDKPDYFWVGKLMAIVMLGPCVMLWLNKCKNTMTNVD